ncbi:MAG: hypothetical protein DI566_13535 [Microbacterium sp.]|nr:MAG: hypothetical protein DI566_13535 [Microbacterium sp.]
MALKLAVEITGSAQGLKAAANEGAAAVKQIGESAKISDADVRKLEQDLERAAQAAVRAANRAATNTASAVNLRLGVQTDFGGDARAADIAAYGRELDAARAKFSPLFAAQQTYKTQLAEIRQAHKLGAIDAKEMAAAIDRTKAAFARQVRDMNAVRAGGQPAHVRQNLMAQGFDVFTSLAGGMNPLLVAAQQGPQVVQAYGGVKETIDGLRAAITATRLVAVGFTATLLTGAIAWNSYLTSTKEVETALDGVGRSSGATAGQLEAIAQRSAAAGEISVKAAREIETALLRTGKVGVESFSRVIEVSRDFAATIGGDVASAGEMLAKILADPAQGAATLRSMNLIDAATATYVARLVEQNRAEEARAELLKALPDRLADAGRSMTLLGRIAEEAGRRASNFFDELGSIPDRLLNGVSPDQELAEIEEKLGQRFRSTPGLREQLLRRRDELRKIVDEENRQRQSKADTNAIVTRATDVVKASPTGELERRRTQLQDEIAALEARLKSGAPYSSNAEQDAQFRKQEAQDLEAKRNALAGLSTATARQAELDQIDVAIMQARDPIEKAELERKRALVASRGQEITSTERAAEAQNVYNRSIAEALASAGNRVADMRAETAAREAVTAAVAAGRVSAAEAEEQIRLELTLRPLMLAMLRAEGAERERYAAAIDAERKAFADAQQARAQSAGQRMITGQTDDLARAKLELELIGSSNQERERAIALLEAEQRIRDAGIATGSAEAAAIRANALAIADLNAQVDRQKAAYSEVSAFGERAIDTVTDKIREQGASFRTLGDIGKSIAKDIEAEFFKLALANPLKNALLGQSNPTLGDAGGALAKMFGGGQSSTEAKVAAAMQSAATMTVTAGTVIVNGGVAASGAGIASAVTNAAAAGGPPATQSAMNAAANDRVAGAFTAGNWLTYANQGATRSQPLDPKLVNAFSFLQERGIQMEVFSGGQPGIGEGGPRVGSTRHDHGGAADVFFSQNGRRLDWANPQDQPVFKDIVSQARANGVTGFGAGPGYMQPGSMHVGFGSPGVWGAGGRGANAPQWLRDAYASPASPSTGAAAAANAAASGVDPAKIQAANANLTAFAATTDKANTGVTGFSGAMDQTAKQVANAATGVGGSAQQLAQTTASVPGQAQGLFQTLFSTLGQGIDALFKALTSSGGGAGGGGIGSLITSLFTGGGGAASAAAPAAGVAPAAAAAVTRSVQASPVVASSVASAARSAGNASASNTSIRLINSTSKAVTLRKADETETEDGRQPTYVIEEMIETAIRRPGSRPNKALRDDFDLRQRPMQRGA